MLPSMYHLLTAGQPSDIKRQVQCRRCFKWVDWKGLKRHERTHLPRDKKPHKCPMPQCGYSDVQKSNLTTHIRVHHPEAQANKNFKGIPCLVPGCTWRTTAHYHRTKHMKYAHPEIQLPSHTTSRSRQSSFDSSCSETVQNPIRLPSYRQLISQLSENSVPPPTLIFQEIIDRSSFPFPLPLENLNPPHPDSSATRFPMRF
ncbi:hypothetical protein C8Q75DRAFT_496625 [Abortiporus biennis]|nr:hypothetical protein C8Q75DRAFT_496625 [Abortiporus biennis]